MADDLRKNHLYSGMTKKQVLELLGEPDFEKQSHVFKYVLGGWSGFRIDYDSLDIYFDSAGRLTKTRIVQH
jgi:outer membrane protein assembly factor BamE (lipoprotein component of BamABCDE complex)